MVVERLAFLDIATALGYGGNHGAPSLHESSYHVAIRRCGLSVRFGASLSLLEG